MKYALLFLISITLASCRTYKLSKEALAWNPYTTGQKLVFENARRDTKVFFISKVHRNIHRTNVYAGTLSSKFEQLSVHISREKHPENPMEQTVLAITGESSKSQTGINFLIDFRPFKFSVPTHQLKDLDSQKGKKLTINGIVYNDILSFPYEKTDPFDSPISKIYWSKRKGIVRIVYGVDEIYDLTQ